MKPCGKKAEVFVPLVQTEVWNPPLKALGVLLIRIYDIRNGTGGVNAFQMFILGYSGTVTIKTEIATIANWGPEYRVAVDIMVHSAGSDWSNTEMWKIPHFFFFFLNPSLREYN